MARKLVKRYRGLTEQATERNRESARLHRRAARAADPEADNQRVADWRLSKMTDEQLFDRFDRAVQLLDKYASEIARRGIDREEVES